MKENILAIGYPLPEDIEKLKWYGDFEGCLSLIDQRLGEDIPETLKDKLRMEKAQIKRMRKNYTVTQEEAIRVLTENIRDFQPQELEQWWKENVVDWIFVNGQVRYIRSFYDNLIKIRLDIRERQLHPAVPEPGERTSAQLRDEMIKFMKQGGTVTCMMWLRAKMELGPELCDSDREVKVYLPYPLEKLQSKDVTFEDASHSFFLAEPKVRIGYPSDYPQRTVMFRGKAKDLKVCEVEYSVKNMVKYVEPKAEAVTEQPSPERMEEYLCEQLPHIAFTPYLRALTKEVVGEETNPLLKARKIYDFITTKVTYSYMRSYAALPVIPEYCASRLRGDCGVQALTFITMCRIAGVPAQWQSGLYAHELEAGCHDWATFYVAPYGWLWADCSFGGAGWREGDMDRWNFYFGNLDPYRVVLASEFQHDFNPPIEQLRADPYDNQLGEVELVGGYAEPDWFEGSVQTLNVVIWKE